MQHVGIEKLRGRLLHVVQNQRLARTNDEADRRTFDFERHFRPRSRAPLLVTHAGSIGLELLTVFGQQGQAGPIARNDAEDSCGECLERERDVDGSREDLQHRILHLQLFHLVQRRAMRPLLLRETRRQRFDPTAGHPRQQQHHAPRRHHLNDDQWPPRDARKRPGDRLQDGNSCHEGPDGPGTCAPRTHVCIEVVTGGASQPFSIKGRLYNGKMTGLLRAPRARRAETH